MFSLTGLQPQFASILTQLSTTLNSTRTACQNVAGRHVCPQRSSSLQASSTESASHTTHTENAVPTLEDLGLQDLGKDIRLADLSCIVRQMTDTTPVPPQTSTWLSMYTSADTFFENKHGFPENRLVENDQNKQTSISSTQTLLLQPRWLPLSFLQQTRGFKTRASRAKATEDETAFNSTLTKFFEKFSQDSTSKMKRNSKLKTMLSDLNGSPELADKLKVSFAEGYMANEQEKKAGLPIRMLRFFLWCTFLTSVFWLMYTLGRSNKAAFQQVMNSKKDYEISPEEITVTFDDVKGADEAKQELQDVVEFLMDPGRFTSLGAKLPNGVLLVGPPGTGKTLLARAVAGEAGVPFFFASGSEFDEVFVGTGATRVRNLFTAAKARAPCVIFIDEIDTVGAKRTSSHMHPYANQTINQLLSEMDGFQQTESVIVLGATNRRDNLDKALLRPGRFDVEVRVFEPDLKGRKDIINLYLKKIKVDADVDVDQLARGTSGFTGAELENMVNQAALKAAKDNCSTVNMVHMEYARDKILMGPEKKSKIPDEETNWITAYHEAGHTLIAYYTKDATKLHKVTIMPRGMSLGHTSFVPEKERYNQTKSQLMAELDVAMGGRVAEEMMYGQEKVTTGASSDFQKATAIATAMVKKFGMSEKVGVRVFEDNEYDTLGMPKIAELSQATTELVDVEIKRILQESYDRAKTMLKSHAHEHKELAKALMKYETLDFEEIKTILEGRAITRKAI